MMTLVFVFAALLSAATPARSQACAGAPVPGVMVPPPVVTALDPITPINPGYNLVEIPAYSPINNPALGNGFVQLCTALGLAGTTSTLYQFNARTGVINSFTCNQIVAPPWQPCRAVMVRPSVPVAVVLPVGAAPGGAVVEGSWPFTFYSDLPGPVGDNLYGVPRTAADVDGDGLLTAEDLCMGLGLAAGGATQVTRFVGGSTILTHNCGTNPQFTVNPGEAVLIRTVCGAGGIPCVTGTMPIL
jgi:hypothetical protein